jgi:hypothetical protein
MLKGNCTLLIWDDDDACNKASPSHSARFSVDVCENFVSEDNPNSKISIKRLYLRRPCMVIPLAPAVVVVVVVAVAAICYGWSPIPIYYAVMLVSKEMVVIAIFRSSLFNVPKMILRKQVFVLLSVEKVRYRAILELIQRLNLPICRGLITFVVL